MRHKQTSDDSMVLGTVISIEDTPSTNEFSFVLSPNVNVAQGQLVEISTPTGQLIASVKSLARRNRYYEFAESISQYAKDSEKSFASAFPASDWEYVVAQCNIMGIFNGKHMQRCAFPPSPGAEVKTADNTIVKTALGLTEQGLHVGELLGSDLAVKLDLSKLMQKHLAVLGMSGSGKSHLVGVILEELLQRRAEQGRLGVVAFDPHGDYISLASPQNKLADKVTIIPGDKIKISTTHLTAIFFSELVPSISSPAKREYAKLFARLKSAAADQGKPLVIEDLIEAAETGKDRTNLADLLTEVKELNLFDAFDYPAVSQEVKPGRLVVFDFSAISSVKVKQAILAFFARRLFYLRREGKVTPFAMVVEEAHAFCREKAQKENSISKPVIETLAREGRKFGACLCLVSQRPVQLSTTALSQCSTFIVMRVTNPYDLDHIGESCEGIDRKTLDHITALRTGEGIVIGEAANFPTFIKVRQRSTTSMGSKSLEEIARQFEQQNSLKQSDAEAFL